MESSNLKNIVVLKKLPSNIIDEAIIVLKSSKKVKKLEKVEKNKNIINEEKKTKDKDYILKEAEMLVNNYVSKIENKQERKIIDKNIKEKYSKLKKYAAISTIICAIESILLITL